MKKIFCGLIILAAMAGVVFMANNPTQKDDGREVGATKEESAEPEPEPVRDLVREQLETMTLEEKAAQMLIVGRSTLVVSGAEQEKLAKAPYGGYILMGGAYGTLVQTQEMVKKLQAAAKIPLIIATDQEGGTVQRLQNITSPKMTEIPDMFLVGEKGDKNYARKIGRVMAKDLRAVGVNVDFAPDADVYSNPNNTVIGRRSFSTDPQVVAEMSQALAEGLEQNGVAATFKHFPGHGDTAVDSHLKLPIIYRTREQIEESDLVPFRNAIRNGAEFIMVGHIALPKITGDNIPATLSRKITTGLLREEMGYENLVITDGLNMGALTKSGFSETEIYAGAISAGADLLLLPENPERAEKVISENISEERINESVYRILRWKREKLEAGSVAEKAE